MAANGLIFSYKGRDLLFFDEPKKNLEDLVCPVCHEIPSDPVQTSCCGHLFCKQCLKDPTCPLCRQRYTSVPDQFNTRKIKSLRVECSNEGCDWKGELGQVVGHFETCKYETIPCPNKCGEKGTRIVIDAHMSEECPFRTVKCDYCQWEDKVNELPEHTTFCPALPVPCPDGCGQSVPRGKLKEHSETCPKRLVKCKYCPIGCVELIPNDNMADHLVQAKDNHLEKAMDKVVEQAVSIESLSAAVDELYAAMESMRELIQSTSEPQNLLLQSPSESKTGSQVCSDTEEVNDISQKGKFPSGPTQTKVPASTTAKTHIIATAKPLTTTNKTHIATANPLTTTAKAHISATATTKSPDVTIGGAHPITTTTKVHTGTVTMASEIKPSVSSTLPLPASTKQSTLPVSAVPRTVPGGGGGLVDSGHRTVLAMSHPSTDDTLGPSQTSRPKGTPVVGSLLPPNYSNLNLPIHTSAGHSDIDISKILLGRGVPTSSAGTVPKIPDAPYMDEIGDLAPTTLHLMKKLGVCQMTGITLNCGIGSVTLSASREQGLDEMRNIFLTSYSELHPPLVQKIKYNPLDKADVLQSFAAECDSKYKNTAFWMDRKNKFLQLASKEEIELERAHKELSSHVTAYQKKRSKFRSGHYLSRSEKPVASTAMGLPATTAPPPTAHTATPPTTHTATPPTTCIATPPTTHTATPPTTCIATPPTTRTATPPTTCIATPPTTRTATPPTTCIATPPTTRTATPPTTRTATPPTTCIATPPTTRTATFTVISLIPQPVMVPLFTPSIFETTANTLEMPDGSAHISPSSSGWVDPRAAHHHKTTQGQLCVSGSNSEASFTNVGSSPLDHPYTCSHITRSTQKEKSPSSEEMMMLNDGRVTLRLKKGNIVEEAVDVIVNAANSHLKHLEGVAADLNEASEGVLQVLSDDYIQSKGPVSVGEVCSTQAGGRLKCSFVFHAVGPKAGEQDKDKTEKLLKSVCTHALQLAESNQVKTIAFPATSAGIYGVDVDVVNRILIKSLSEYPYAPTSSVKEVRLVIFPEDTFEHFLGYFRRKRNHLMKKGRGVSPGCVPSRVPSGSFKNEDKC